MPYSIVVRAFELFWFFAKNTKGDFEKVVQNELKNILKVEVGVNRQPGFQWGQS